MATVQEPRRQFDQAETQRRVGHPLQSLRKYIRGYVLIEGALLAVLYLALWYWIGLALDYGCFKLFAFDWVQELNNAFSETQALTFRAVLLGLLIVGLLVLVAVKIGLRLVKEFKDSALALVLERRFPKQLGDRLITAVELADPRRGEKYGFSPVMIEHTILDAADRVEKVPVREVFDWGRLKALGLWCFFLTIGLYLILGAGFCAVGALTGGSTSPIDYLWQFGDTSATYVERNLLLQNSYWPRNAFLEVVRFQDTPKHRNEMRVGRDEQRPDVQVRAIRWVVADRRSPDGWRALRWLDLPHYLDQALLDKFDISMDWPHWTIDLDDLDAAVPGGFLPAAWHNKTRAEVHAQIHQGNFLKNLQDAGYEKAVADLINWPAWTVDRLESQLEKKAIKEKLMVEHAAAQRAWQQIILDLEEAAASPRYSRQLRKLDIPKEVTVYYRGETTKSSSTHEVLPDNKYSVGLNELKESVRFTVRGGDYYTPYKKITLVPPPTVAAIKIDKEEPAYLYHWLQGDQTPLKGKKQVFKNLSVSTTGDRSTIPVPYGVDLVIRCEADRPLKQGIRLRPPQGAELAQIPDVQVHHVEGMKEFSIALKNVQRTQEFNFEFNDEDNVKGRRRIKIQPEIDAPPEISKLDLAVVLRKPRVKADPGKSAGGAAVDGYLITPIAKLPLNGVIKDDHGLTRLEWAFEVEQVRVELFGPSAGKAPPPKPLSPAIARIITAGISPASQQPISLWGVQGYWQLMAKIVQAELDKTQARPPTQYAALTEFAGRLAGREYLRKPLVDFDQYLLRTPKQDEFPFLKQHELKDREEFNVGVTLPSLRVRDPQREGQLHYLIKLAVSATDNNIETGNDPAKFGSTRRSEPAIPLLVVSETELLTQVALEEEVISERMDKVLFKLRNAQTTLSEQITKLQSPGSDLSLVALRVDEVRKFLLDGASNTREILNDYTRILTELRVNQVREEKLISVEDKIVRKLEAILNQSDGNFYLAEEAVNKLYQGVDDDASAKRDDNRNAHYKSAELARYELNTLVEKLNEVAREMASGVDWAKSLELILAIERHQREIRDRLDREHADRIRELFELLNPPKK